MSLKLLQQICYVLITLFLLVNNFSSHKSFGGNLFRSKVDFDFIISVCLDARRITRKAKENCLCAHLSDSMPMNNSSLCVELVGECNIKGVINFSFDSWAWKLAVDSHHNMLQAIWFLEHVLHIKLVVPHLCSNHY